jgi:hypothetical protein
MRKDAAEGGARHRIPVHEGAGLRQVDAPGDAAGPVGVQQHHLLAGAVVAQAGDGRHRVLQAVEHSPSSSREIRASAGWTARPSSSGRARSGCADGQRARDEAGVQFEAVEGSALQRRRLALQWKPQVDVGRGRAGRSAVGVAQHQPEPIRDPRRERRSRAAPCAAESGSSRGPTNCRRLGTSVSPCACRSAPPGVAQAASRQAPRIVQSIRPRRMVIAASGHRMLTARAGRPQDPDAAPVG